MELKPTNALRALLDRMPHGLQQKGRDLMPGFEISRRGLGIYAELKTPEGQVFTLQFQFEPQHQSISSCACDCRQGKRGDVCEHLAGLTAKLLESFPSDRNEAAQHSLFFLDKYLNTDTFQNPGFELSVNIKVENDVLTPEIDIRRLHSEGPGAPAKRFTANDSYRFEQAFPEDQGLLQYLQNFRQAIFYSDFDARQKFPWGFWLSLVGHPRLTLDQHHIRMKAGRLSCAFAPVDDGSQVTLRALPERLGSEETRIFTIDGGAILHDVDAAQLTLFQIDGLRLSILKELLDVKPIMNREEILGNLHRIEKLQKLFDLKLPPIVESLMSETEPHLTLQLELSPDAGLLIKPRIAYEGSDMRIMPGSDGQFLAGEDSALVKRDIDGERQLKAQFVRSFPDHLGSERSGEIQIPDVDRALEALDWLETQSWRTEWLKSPLKVHRPKKAPVLRIHVTSDARIKVFLLSENDQFELDTFPREDEALIGSNYVAVREREWLTINAHIREHLNRLKFAVDNRESSMRLRETGLALLSDLPDVDWVGDPKWIGKIARWRKLSSGEHAPPEGLKATLRNYQMEGYRWLRRMSELGIGVCLADDMGLGKTVQSLATLLDRKDEGPILVVAPASVIYNWKEEIERFAPELHPVLYGETGRGKSLGKFKAGDVVLISYALVLRDVDKLVKKQWGTLVLDEAQFIKNALSQTAIAVSKLSRKWAVALTGTPLENHLGELWSIFRMVDPNILGDLPSFRKNFMVPIGRDRDSHRLETLRTMIKPFILRRAKSEVLDDLPKRSDITLKVELGEAQRSKYEQERARILNQLDSGKHNLRMRLLTGILRLRQISCHPSLIEPKYKGESAKLRLFSELIQELVNESHKALVFSQFTSFLELIARELNRIHVPYVIMTGDTPVKHRQAIIQRFQEGETPVFLVSLRAGGTGINLTQANYVIHMDPWWNPAVEEQATDRAHRIGQTQPITVYRLIAWQTVEEAIINVHDRKRELMEGLLAGQDRAGKLSIDDLVALIRNQPL